jgi:hypothetical protein
MDEATKELLRQEIERAYGPFNGCFCGLRQLQVVAKYNKRIYEYNERINYRYITNTNTKNDDADTTPKTSTNY